MFPGSEPFHEVQWVRVALYLLLGPVLIGHVCTWLKERYRWAGGYTRKINHVGIMLVTAPLLVVLPDRELMMSVMVATTLQIGLYSAAAYSRGPALHALAAHSLRERDAPDARFFFLMPMITTNLALAAAVLLFPMTLVKIAFFTVALGDGLAEPVGLWLGRRNGYRVRDPFWGRYNAKSLAGSLTVFVFAVGVAGVFWAPMSAAMDMRFVAGLGIYGLAMTALEALAPRGMDNMIMILLGPVVLQVLTLTLGVAA